jgi:hypothetical protein
MTEKNIAVIGAGYWGKNLVRNFHQLGVLKTICDGAQPIREEMSKLYPDACITASVSDVFKDNDTIVCGHTIGRYAFIGAGAVVTKDVPDHALMVGNPARKIGWMCEWKNCPLC